MPFASSSQFHQFSNLIQEHQPKLKKRMKSKKASVLIVAVLLIVLLQVPTAMPARQLPSHNSPKRVRGETVEVAGSRLPDCSHACGSCSPCRLVMVRFFCASVEDSETCPMAYKCMCSDKSFPVP